ncbi:MAG: hypothetical protein EP335_15685 [Alphaproteobacteria bacterium]|nr:MAG: hypothetical protein EP335_15685 [Alphaproteobacteria bacterium]
MLRLMLGLMLGLTLATLFAPSPVAAVPETAEAGNPGEKVGHLSDLFPKYDDYLELAEEQQLSFAPLYRLSFKDGSPASLMISFEFAGQRYHFAPLPDGLVLFRPSRAMLAENPDLWARGPAGKLKPDLKMEILAGLRLRYDMKELHRRTHDAWSEAKKLDGFLSFFSARHSKLLVVFPDTCPDARWSVTGRDGEEIAGGNAVDARAEVDLGVKAIRKARELSLACVPERLLLD